MQVLFAGQIQEIPRWGCPSVIAPNVPENCMKMKKKMVQRDESKSILYNSTTEWILNPSVIDLEFFAWAWIRDYSP